MSSEARVRDRWAARSDLDASSPSQLSRYFRTPDQDPHVRFSVWNEEGVAQAALSIDEEEAARLSALLAPRPAQEAASQLPAALNLGAPAADAQGMAVALRHPLALMVVLVAILATAGVFVFARPEYRPEYESKMIDFSKQQYYSPASVRQAFAAEGIRLREASRVGGMLILSSTPGHLTADALNVVVGPRTGTGSYGPELEPYDERFGNVLVTYGGKDERVIEHVEAAVDALR